MSAQRGPQCLVCRANTLLIGENDKAHFYRCILCQNTTIRRKPGSQMAIAISESEGYRTGTGDRIRGDSDAPDSSEGSQSEHPRIALSRVGETVADLRRLQVEASAAEHTFRTAVRAAIAAGVTPLEIAERSGLSRDRIYQIRDGRNTNRGGAALERVPGAPRPRQ